MLEPKKQLTVYTALFGGYDKLYEPVEPEDYEFVCYTDNPNIKSENWEIRCVDRSKDRHPRWDARLYKMLGFINLPTDQTLWIDARQQFVRIKEIPEYDNILIHTHPKRKSAYEEAEFCVKHGVGDPDGIKKLIQIMLDSGFPLDFGLWYSGVIWRKKNDDLSYFCKEWWDLVSRVSIRDQISLPYVLWGTQLSYTSIDLPCKLDRFDSYVELIAHPHEKQDYH